MLERPTALLLIPLLLLPSFLFLIPMPAMAAGPPSQPSGHPLPPGTVTAYNSWNLTQSCPVTADASEPLQPLNVWRTQLLIPMLLVRGRPSGPFVNQTFILTAGGVLRVSDDRGNSFSITVPTPLSGSSVTTTLMGNSSTAVEESTVSTSAGVVAEVKLTVSTYHRFCYPAGVRLVISGDVMWPTSSGTVSMLFGSEPRFPSQPGSGNATVGTVGYRATFGNPSGVGIGFDWSDSKALHPTYDAATNAVDYDVGDTFKIDPVTVATSGSNGATAYDNQGQTCYASGRYWLFYFDGTNEGWATSVDGITWSSETTITTGGGLGASFAFHCTGTSVYYTAAAQSNGAAIYYDSGTLNADGTISWGTESQFSTTAGGIRGVSTAFDTDGRWWVSFGSLGSTTDIEVWVCATPSACSWSQSTFFDFGGGSYVAYTKIVPLTSGRVALVYDSGPNTVSSLSIKTFDGSSWSAEATTSGSTYGLYQGSCVAIGDTTECATYDNDVQVGYISASYDGNSPQWSSETVVGASCSSPYASIGTDGSSRLVVTYVCNGGSSASFVESFDGGSNWTAPFLISSSQSSPRWVTMSPLLTPVGYFFAAWTSGSGSPYDVSFVTVPSAVPIADLGAPAWARPGLSPYESYFSEFSDYLSPGNGLVSVELGTLDLPGRGLDFAPSLVYSEPYAFGSSGSPYLYDNYTGASLGFGWGLNLPWMGADYLHLSDGQAYPYEWSGNQFVYRGVTDFNLTRNSDGSYALWLPDGTRFGFDSAKQLISETDSTGNNTITFAYGSNGYISNATDTIGRTTTFNYSSANQLASVSEGGRTWTMAYIGNQLTSLTDPLSRTTSFHYAGTTGADAWLLSAVVFPTGGEVTYTFKSRVAGTEASAYSADSRNVYYGQNHLSLSQNISYTVTNGQVTWANTTISDGTTVHEYLDDNFQYAKNLMKTYAYNGTGALEQITETDSDASGRTNATKTYAASGTLLSEYVAKYDEWGNLIYSNDTLGQQTWYSYANTADAGIFAGAGGVYVPSISTSLSATTITAGGSVHDSAALTGELGTAGGTVTYYYSTTDSCPYSGATAVNTVTVTDGSVPSSNSVTFNSAGTYYWYAVYSGDPNDAGATGACEPLTVKVQQYYLTMTAETGGSVSPSSGYYAAGTQVQITARADSGYTFIGWSGSGGGGYYTGSSNPATVTMNGNVQETASFKRVQYSLTISAPTWMGASPSPGTYSYDSGTQVQISLTNTYACKNDLAYDFTGWSGSGSGSYTGTSSSATVTMNGDIGETAEYTTTRVSICPNVPMSSQASAPKASSSSLSTMAASGFGPAVASSFSGSPDAPGPALQTSGAPASAAQPALKPADPSGTCSDSGFYSVSVNPGVHDLLLGQCDFQNGPSSPQQETFYNYNTAGEALAMKVSHDGGWLYTAYTHDQYGNVLSATNPDGVTAYSQYSSAYGSAYLTKAWTPDGGKNVTTSYTYDSNTGDMLSVTDPNDQTTSYTYDALGRQTSVTYPAVNGAAATAYTYYNDNNNTMKTVDPDGHVTISYFDGLSRETEVQVMNGTNAFSTVYYTYDWLDQVATKTTATGHTYTYSYDWDGRLTNVTNPDGTYETTAYNLTANTKTVTDEDGHPTVYQYNRDGWLTSVKEYNSSTTYYLTKYSYDLSGNMLSVTDAKNQVTSYQYDDLNRLVTTTFPDSTYEAKTYDAIGNLLTRTTANGTTISYAYDSLNRLVNVTYPGSGGNVTYTYDANGNRLSQVSPSAKDYYTYDARDRLTNQTEVVEGTSLTTLYAYDAAGNVVQITYPDGYQLSMAYDGVGWLQSVGNFASLNYTADGQISTIHYGDGEVATYTYDSRDRPTQIRVVYGSTVELDLNYTYDGTGNVLSENSQNYTYDWMNRLTSSSGPWGSISYTYDSVGNRLTMVNGTNTVNYTYGSFNRLTSAGNVNYTYDANGDMITKSGGWAYSYDNENRLTSVTHNGVTVQQNLYDGDGNRVEQTTHGGSVVYSYQGVSILYQKNLTSGTTTKSFYAGGIQVAQMVNYTTYYLHQDALGSTRLVMTSSMLLSFSSNFGAYGSNYAMSGAEAFQYTGKLLDEATGLYYEGARYYDPSTGRFVTEDSVVGITTDPMSLNRYMYARDNPMKIVDMNGHEWWNPVADLTTAASDVVGAATDVANAASNAWNSLQPQNQAIVVTAGTDVLAVGAVISVPLTGGFTAPLASAAVGAAVSTTSYTIFSGSSATATGALTAAGVGAAAGLVTFGVGGALTGAGASAAVSAAGATFAGNFASGVLQTIAGGSGLTIHSLVSIALTSAITAPIGAAGSYLTEATGLSGVGGRASRLSTLWTGLTSPEDAPRAAFQVYSNPNYGVYSTTLSFASQVAAFATRSIIL